jgi:hypothetical protein
MKMADIGTLGLSKKTVNEIEVDASDLIRHDEFNRSRGDYRETTIDRLVKLEIPFHSDCNTVHNFFKRFLKVVCPYCKIWIPVGVTLIQLL